MRLYERVIEACLASEKNFQASFRTALDELGITVKEFSEESKIPLSTLYKIMSGKRKEPRASTLRQIINGIRRLEGAEAAENLVGVIAARPVLDTIRGRKIELNGRYVTIREYPASSMEECIIAAVQARRDGAKALVCAPIVSTTIEKIIDIPVSTIMPKEETLVEAVKRVATKIEFK